MTECAQCGDCCTGFPLNTPERADIWGRRMLAATGRNGAGGVEAAAPTARCVAWLSNLIPVAGPFVVVRIDKDGKEHRELRWRYLCPVFDEATRLCSDHANRPEVCRGFPRYGRDMAAGDYKSLSPRCSFVADDPSVTMLPIIEVRNGRTDAKPEDVRHCAA